jgi:hypothetical protein
MKENNQFCVWRDQLIIMEKVVLKIMAFLSLSGLTNFDWIKMFILCLHWASLRFFVISGPPESPVHEPSIPESLPAQKILL